MADYTYNIGGKMVKVITSYDCPPIPTRSCDWSAYVEGDEDGIIGRGATEEDALEELAWQLDEIYNPLILV